MKKLLLFTSILLLWTLVSQAQWQPDVRITNAPSSSTTSLNNAWNVAASGDIIHIAWDDQRDGNYEIYYNSSTNAGLRWGTDTRLTNDPAYSFSPSLAVSDTAVHMVWQDYRDGNYEIYYKRDTTANTVGINESVNSGNNFQIFPNPFSDEIKVNNSKNELCEIIIYDITSRKLIQRSFTNTVTINTSQLGKGIYIFEVMNNNAILENGKIIKD